MTSSGSTELLGDDPPLGVISDRERSSFIYPGWWTVVSSFVIFFVGSGTVYYCYGNFAVEFEHEFSASRTFVSLGYTMVLVVSGLGSIGAGWLTDRWPIRRSLLLGVLGTGIGLILTGFANSMLQVVLIFGLLVALSDIFLGSITLNYLVSHWFERRRGLAIGLSVLGASLAAILFPPLSSVLIGLFGWRITFGIFGALTLLLAIPVMFARIPTEMPLLEQRPRPVATVSAESGSTAEVKATALYRTSSFWIITATIGTMIGVNGAMTVSLVPYARDKGISPANAALLMSILGTGGLTGKIVFGAIADRIPLHHALRAGLTALIMGLGILTWAPNYPMLALAALIFGLGLGGMLPVWGTINANVFGLSAFGRVMGAQRTVMTPLALLCPLAPGWLFDRTGHYGGAFLLLAVLLMAALATTFINRRWMLSRVDR